MGEAEASSSTPRDRGIGSETVVAAIAAVFAAAAALVASAGGAGISNDSTVYLSTGLNLAAGNGLRDWSGGIVTVFPPGISAVVATGRLLGIDADATVRALNASALAGTVWLGFVLLRRHVRSRTLVIGATVLVAVSTPLLDTAKMVWTEPVFIVACLGLILVVERASEPSDPRSGAVLVAGAAALVWVAFMFRYAGIVLIPIGTLSIAIVRWRNGWKSAVAHAASFAVAAAVVPGIWMLRNHAVDGTLMGPRYPSNDTILTFAKPFVTTLGSWIVPSPVPAIVQSLVGLTVIVALAAGVGWSVGRVVRSRGRVAESPVPVPLAPLWCFVTIYAVFLAVTQLTTAVDLVDSRLMAPLWVPLVVLAAVALDRLAVHVPARRTGIVAGGVLSVSAVFLALQATAFARSVSYSAVHGEEYTGDEWRNSATVKAAKRLPVDAAVYSNRPGGVWAATGRQPVRGSPQLGNYRSDTKLAFPASFATEVACRESYLVWFEDKADFRYRPDVIARHVMTEPVHIASDGAVYRLSAPANVPAPTSC